jgi:hypothetical protein
LDEFVDVVDDGVRAHLIAGSRAITSSILFRTAAIIGSSRYSTRRLRNDLTR